MKSDGTSLSQGKRAFQGNVFAFGPATSTSLSRGWESTVLPQNLIHDLSHFIGRHNFQILFDIVGDIPEIRIVSGRKDHPLHPGAMRRQELLLDTADGEDPAAEGQFSGQGDVSSTRTLYEQ